MPIRLNLLAEAQAAEEMRRRDPVKRVAWAAALLICLMLVWSSSLQLKAMHTSREVDQAQGQMNNVTNEYQRVLDNQKKVDEVRHKLASLVQLATNRFSQASVLNALQQTTVDDVQLLHLRTEQSYTFVDEVKPRTNDTRVILGKPASSTERILLSLDGGDTSPNPGDQVAKLKEALANNPYFKAMLIRSNAINLKSLSSPAFSPATGKRGVTFTLECRLPEKSR
jgi:hypothetical protein